MVSSCYQWACTVVAGSAHRTAEHCIKKYHDWVDDSQGEFSEQKGWRGQQMLWKSYVEDPRWLRDKVWKSYYYYFRGKDVIWIPRLFFLASSFLLFPLLRSFLATELSRVSQSVSELEVGIIFSRKLHHWLRRSRRVARDGEEMVAFLSTAYNQGGHVLSNGFVKSKIDVQCASIGFHLEKSCDQLVFRVQSQWPCTAACRL